MSSLLSPPFVITPTNVTPAFLPLSLTFTSTQQRPPLQLGASSLWVGPEPPSSHQQKLSRANCLMRPIFCCELLIKEQTQPTINLVLGKKLGLQQTEENSQGGTPRKHPPAPPQSARQVTQTLAYHRGGPRAAPVGSLLPGLTSWFPVSRFKSKVRQAGWRPL